MRPGFWQIVVVVVLLIAFFRSPLGRLLRCVFRWMRATPQQKRPAFFKCPKCGAELPTNANFCSRCGQRLDCIDV